MATPRKWERGARIETAEQAIACILRGEPIYERHKLQTSGWTRSWQINYVKSAIGHLYLAIPVNRNPTP